MKTFEDTRRDLSGGQEEALFRKLWLAAGGEESGQEGFAAILRGEQRITLVAAQAKLVDHTGRLIPPAGFQPAVVDANRSFRFVQPRLSAENNVTVLARLQSFFPDKTFPSAEEFQDWSEALRLALSPDRQIMNLLGGLCLPVAFPQIIVVDYGATLEQVFLAAVGRSYQAQFPGRKFVNHRKGTLSGQVTCVLESRQDRLLAKLAEGPVAGIYFPAALQGFSISAAREMVQMLPEGFVLTGGIEAAVALTGYPGTLARDYQTPGLDCAANVWQSAGLSMLFKADDDRLEFGYGALRAREGCSSGLLFLG